MSASCSCRSSAHHSPLIECEASLCPARQHQSLPLYSKVRAWRQVQLRPSRIESDHILTCIFISSARRLDAIERTSICEELSPQSPKVPVNRCDQTCSSCKLDLRVSNNSSSRSSLSLSQKSQARKPLSTWANCEKVSDSRLTRGSAGSPQAFAEKLLTTETSYISASTDAIPYVK